MNRIMLSTVCQAETCPLPYPDRATTDPHPRHTDHAPDRSPGSVAVRDNPLNEVASSGPAHRV
jgi:hypothetical protein